MTEAFRRSRTYSNSTSVKLEDESSRNYSYRKLCEDHFRCPSAAQFTRKDLTQPLLKHTPDEEKEVVVKIWRTIVRFMSEVQSGSETTTTFDRSSTRSRRSTLSHLRQRSASVSSGLSSVASEYESQLTTASDRQSETGSTLSGTWNTVRLKQLTAKLRQGLRRSSTADRQRSNDSAENSPSTPFGHVQYVIGWGLLKPILRDEIYCMVLRQLTNNSQKLGRLRGWVLLSLVVGIFLPSEKILLYVARFIDEGPAAFASDIKKLFVRLITDGPRHQPPSYAEYKAAMERKPMEIAVTLMDGSVQYVSVDPSTTSSEVISGIAKAIDLNEKFGFSLFIAIENRVSSLGNEGDKICDAISQCEQVFRASHSRQETEAPWRLFMRKEMFSPWDDVSSDSVAISLTYAQVTRGVVLGEYACDTDSELVALAAKEYYCEFENDVSEAGLVSLLPAYVPSSRLRGDSARLRCWARQVAQRYRILFTLIENEDTTRRPVEEVKAEVVNWAKVKWSAIFSSFFDGIRLSGPNWDDDIKSATLAINSSGLLIIDEASGKKVLSATYWQISSVAGEGQDASLRSISGNDVIVSLVNGSVIKLQTIDANDIYRLINYCVNGIKERSVWAIARRDYDGSAKGHLELFEGDLVRLERPAKQEAMTSLIAAGTNMATLKVGRLPTDLLHIIATLEEPTEEMLGSFRSQCNQSTRQSRTETADSKESIGVIDASIGASSSSASSAESSSTSREHEADDDAVANSSLSDYARHETSQIGCEAIQLLTKASAV